MRCPWRIARLWACKRDWLGKHWGFPAEIHKYIKYFGQYYHLSKSFQFMYPSFRFTINRGMMTSFSNIHLLSNKSKRNEKSTNRNCWWQLYQKQVFKSTFHVSRFVSDAFVVYRFVCLFVCFLYSHISRGCKVIYFLIFQRFVCILDSLSHSFIHSFIHSYQFISFN